jgi:hypothetical protein
MIFLDVRKQIIFDVAVKYKILAFFITFLYIDNWFYLSKDSHDMFRLANSAGNSSKISHTMAMTNP